MTVDLLFALIVLFLSIMGFIGSLSLSVTANPNTGSPVGAGAMPLAYSLILFVLAILYFVFEVRKSTKKIHWFKFLERPASEGLVFYLLCIGMFIFMHFFGTALALLFFSITSLLFLKRLPVWKNLVFSIAWIGALYTVFVVLLHVPFEIGTFFRGLR